MRDTDVAAGSDVDLKAPPSTTDAVTDPLALFASEADLARPAAAAGQAMPSRPVAAPADFRSVVASAAPPSPSPGLFVHERTSLLLSEVLERLGGLEWVEAVAIVQAVCAALADDAEPAVPSLAGASITAHGGVVVLARGAERGAPGPPLARLLHSLAGAGAVPTALRLFITKWVSLTEGHSMKQFSAELGYFARPDGVVIIRAVYERAMAAPPRMPEPGPRPAQADAAEKRTRVAGPRRRSSGRRRRLAIAVVVLLSVAVGSVSLWFAWAPAGERAPREWQALLSRAAGGLRGAVAEVSKRLGGIVSGSAAPANGSASAARAVQSASTPESQRGAAARTSSQGGTARRRDSQAGTSQAGSSPSLSASSVPAVLPAAPLEPQVIPLEVETQTAPLVDTASGRDTDDPQVVYSRADSDVKPPELRHPQLPPPPLSGGQKDVNTIELIVSETGAVERVRLLTAPRRMADMMLLSGAKAWVFDPAAKDGQPVKYRLVFSWSALP